ncbi:retinol-binding protein pinta-like isoform X2 [Photinus pyralis]|uniref:retinol-binding protein pinta-like isoform X2 n=1 Tax=Photinus pyralis TaxID=7054 RepID=UPI001267762F|nr:retinol-binding protein pinta-like isoform X2 [Photinus pyralis]
MIVAYVAFNTMDNNALNICKEEDLNEVAESIQNDLRLIRNWLKKQPHLNVRDDDKSLLIFLRSSKYSIQRTKEKLDNYYSMFTLLPEIFEDRDPFSADIQALDLNTAAFGVYVVSDLGKCSVKYVLQFTPNSITKHIYCIETGYPLRLKGVQIENCPSAMELVLSMVNACLNGKISKRLHVYKANSNLKGLQKEIPIELMPIEYGGNNGSIKELGAIWKKKVESYRDWFLDNAKYKTMEDLRLGPPKTSADELGLDGSFRKLDID